MVQIEYGEPGRQVRMSTRRVGDGLLEEVLEREEQLDRRIETERHVRQLASLAELVEYLLDRRFVLADRRDSVDIRQIVENVQRVERRRIAVHHEQLHAVAAVGVGALQQRTDDLNEAAEKSLDAEERVEKVVEILRDEQRM